LLSNIYEARSELPICYPIYTKLAASLFLNRKVKYEARSESPI
jgi:hypothetical protein